MIEFCKTKNKDYHIKDSTMTGDLKTKKPGAAASLFAKRKTLTISGG